MTDLQQEILKRADFIMQTIGDKVKIASDFVLEQLPDIVQQYIMYGRIVLTMYIIMGLGLLCVSYVFWVNGLWKNKYGWEEDIEFKGIVAFVIGVVSAILGVAMLFINAKEAIMVWVAPKIWLITEIANLVKATH